MKISKDLAERVAKEIEAGVSRVDCEKIFNYSHTQFHHWMKKVPYFANAIKAAEMGCKVWHVKNIKRASIKHWTASAWWLERKFPEEFAKRVEVTGAGGDPLYPGNGTIDKDDAKV